MRRVLSSYEDYYLRARPIRRLTRMATLAPGPAAGYRDFEISIQRNSRPLSEPIPYGEFVPLVVERASGAPHRRVAVFAGGLLTRSRRTIRAVSDSISASLLESQSFTLVSDPTHSNKTFPEGADAYLMRVVLHDWNDEDALRILKTRRRAIPAHGKLLIVDSVLKPSNEPDLGRFNDMAMLAVAPGGRERTEVEFRDLLRRAGFAVTRVIPTSGLTLIVEAHPV